MNELLNLLVPVIGLLVNTVTQVIIARYFKRLGMLKSIVAGFIAGFLVLIIMQVLATGLSIGFLALNSLIYAALGYCYFHFINLGETARRIRILTELSDQPGGLTADELSQRYNARMMLDARIRRLVDNRQIRESESRFTVSSPIMLFSAQIILLLKLIIMGKRSEFE